MPTLPKEAVGAVVAAIVAGLVAFYSLKQTLALHVEVCNRKSLILDSLELFREIPFHMENDNRHIY